jgi:hypothetical protein
MQSEELAPGVRDLINRHLRSMDHAEALLHLVDAPNDAHRLDAVATRHRWARAVAAQVLADLVDTGIAIQSNDGFRLATGAVDGSCLARLSELYHMHPVALVRAIYAAPFRVQPLVRPTRANSDTPPSA